MKQRNKVPCNTLNTRSKEPALVWYIDDEKFNILSNELTLLSHFDRMNVKYVKTEYSAIFRLVYRTHSLIHTHVCKPSSSISQKCISSVCRIHVLFAS